MFANTVKSAALALGLALTAGAATAQDSHTLTVDVTDIRAGTTPLYVSVQAEADYMSERAETGRIVPVPASHETVALEVPAGRYAVSIWHDTDNDGTFSRSADYMPLDGWASSGTVPTSRAPRFDEVALDVDRPTRTTLKMIYPG